MVYGVAGIAEALDPLRGCGEPPVHLLVGGRQAAGSGRNVGQTFRCF